MRKNSELYFIINQKYKSKYDKAEQLLLDYTGSTKWKEIEKITWTSSEIIDLLIKYFGDNL